MPRIFIAASLLAVALFAVTLIGLALHLDPPPAHDKPLFQWAQIDEPTVALFQRTCQSCQSKHTQRPSYSRIPPTPWVIGKDLDNGRRHSNFFNCDSCRLEEQNLASQERQHIHEWSRGEKKCLRAAENRTLILPYPALRGGPHERSESTGHSDAHVKSRLHMG